MFTEWADSMAYSLTMVISKNATIGWPRDMARTASLTGVSFRPRKPCPLRLRTRRIRRPWPTPNWQQPRSPKRCARMKRRHSPNLGLRKTNSMMPMLSKPLPRQSQSKTPQRVLNFAISRVTLGLSICLHSDIAPSFLLFFAMVSCVE